MFLYIFLLFLPVIIFVLFHLIVDFLIYWSQYLLTFLHFQLFLNLLIYLLLNVAQQILMNWRANFASSF